MSIRFSENQSFSPKKPIFYFLFFFLFCLIFVRADPFSRESIFDPLICLFINDLPHPCFCDKSRLLHQRLCDLISISCISFRSINYYMMHEDPIYSCCKTMYRSLHVSLCKSIYQLAMSVPAERLFSESGNVVTDKRKKLSPRSLRCTLLFLNALNAIFKKLIL